MLTDEPVANYGLLKLLHTKILAAKPYQSCSSAKSPLSVGEG
jgi:hypothetical protein